MTNSSRNYKGDDSRWVIKKFNCHKVYFLKIGKRHTNAHLFWDMAKSIYEARVKAGGKGKEEPDN